MRRPLILTAVVVALIKLATLAVDATPLFFMGDSASYLESPIRGFMLTGHPFGYTLPVRWFAVASGSLTSLVAAQALAGAATAWLLAFALLTFFQARPIVAIVAAAVCALEPLQLVHERLVMAETFALFAFAMYLVLAMAYVRHPHVLLLLAAVATGIALISLRVVYAPLALGTAILLPLLALAPPTFQAWRPRLMRSAVHLAIGLAVTLALHVGYRYQIGVWAGEAPTYLPDQGYFLAAGWAPLLRVEDTDDPRAAEVVARLTAGGKYPLRDRWQREYQRWADEGLINQLRRAYGGDNRAARQAAGDMALHALRRDPIAILRLALRTYRDYWGQNVAFQRDRLLIEQGSDRAFPEAFVQLARDRFGLDVAASWSTMTPAKRYHLAGGPWYPVLLLYPLLGALSVVACRREARALAATVLILSSALLALTLLGTQFPIWRYLHPLTFPTLLALALITDRLTRVGKFARPVSTM